MVANQKKDKTKPRGGQKKLECKDNGQTKGEAHKNIS